MKRTRFLMVFACALAIGMGRVSATAAAPAGGYDSWVQVDSTTVNGGWFSADTDTALITIFMSNPIAGHAFTLPAQVIINNALIGYQWISDPQNVYLAGGGQASATFAWADSLATPFLQYDITARLLIPQAQKDNVVVNGDFEEGLGGWTITQDNWPGWGVEHTTLADGDSDGEAHVYMTIYDTEGYQPQIQQSIQLPAGDSSFIHLRFKMSTDDVLWGMGIGFIGLQRGNGLYGFWRASGPPPADTPTQHLVWATEQWHDVQLTADQIPGGSGDELIIYSRAMMSTGSSYAQVVVDNYLDDIGVSDNDPTYIEKYSAYTWTGLDAQILGTYEDLLSECTHQSYPGDMGKIFDTLPLLGTLNMWDNMHNHLCAAGIYQDQGRVIHKNIAVLQALFTLYDGPMEMVELTTGAKVVDVSSILASTQAIADVFEPMAGQSVSPRDAEEAVVAMGDIAFDSGAMPREEAMVYGNVRSVIRWLDPAKSETAFVSADSLGITHSFITETRPDSLTWLLVGREPRVLGEEVALTTQDTLRFSFVAESDGLTDIAWLHDDHGQPRTIVLNDIRLSTGDLLWTDVTGETSSFQFYIDRGADGSIDSTITVEPTTGVGIPAARIVHLVSYPNPFNPTTTLSFDLPEAGHVDLRIFDVAGRCVSHLINRSLDSGPQVQTWNGCDDNGLRLGSGVYLAQLTYGDQRARTRLVAIK